MIEFYLFDLIQNKKLRNNGDLQIKRRETQMNTMKNVYMIRVNF